MDDTDRKDGTRGGGENTLQPLSIGTFGTTLLIGGVLAGAIGAVATWAWARRRNKKAAR